MNNTSKISYQTSVSQSLSTRAYNVLIGLFIFMGIGVTALTMFVMKDSVGLIAVHPIVFSILYLVVALVGIRFVHTSGSMLTAFLGYMLLTIPTGLLLATWVPHESADAILYAASLTVAIVGTMIILATIFPNAFLSMGRILFVSLLSFILVEAVMLIFFRGEPAFMDTICILIFTLYVGYDWAKGIKQENTVKNAMIVAIELYLDIINIFIRILSSNSRSRK